MAMEKVFGRHRAEVKTLAGVYGSAYEGDEGFAAIQKDVEAFAEDCMRATVVLSAREAPGDCAATLIDRRAWRQEGAIGLRWVDGHFVQTAARPSDYQRPWAPPTVARAALPASSPPDATPKVEDLEAGD